VKTKSMILVATILAILVSADGVTGGEVDDTFRAVYHPALKVTKTSGYVKIDGCLNDPGWSGAARAKSFVENSPGDQVKPQVETHALMTYDDHRLYAAFICHEDPATIRAALCERDRLRTNQDMVGLLIDTYGDASWAYILNVNPYGVQMDALWSPTTGEDESYDLIWESAAQITDSGYQVEIAIPFSSLRFPNQVQQKWKVEFYRHRYRESHYEYSWAAYDRDEPCWPCRWGTVSGIENVRPGRGIELLPSVMAFQSGDLTGAGTTERPYDFVNHDPDGEASVGAKYAITSNVTAEATYNPDFSQVESDAAQIDVNSSYAIFYPERRPFFQEGSDLFRTWVNVFYTRTINDPQFAGKATARIDRASIAYVAARDEHSPIIVPFEESSAYLLTGKSISNIFRYRHGFGTDSHMGLLATDRRLEGGGSGTLLNLDSQLLLHRNLRLQFQLIGTHTVESDDSRLTSQINQAMDVGLIDSTFDSGSHTSAYDGESYSGHAVIVNLRERSRHFSVDASYWELSPTFRADNGFQTYNNRRQTDLAVGYTHYFDNAFVDRINPHVQVGTVWNFEGQKKDQYVWFNLHTYLKVAQIYLRTMHMRSAEKYGKVQYDNIWTWFQSGSASLGNLLDFGGSILYARNIARRLLVPDKEIILSLWANLKPLDRLLVETSYDFNNSHHGKTGEKLFEGYIARTRLNFQVTAELSSRLVVQYNDFYRTWDIDPLLTYRLSPFSVLYVGSAYEYCRFHCLGKDGIGRATRMTSRQFFMKLQYLFQI
jgi:hypothetical protein